MFILKAVIETMISISVILFTVHMISKAEDSDGEIQLTKKGVLTICLMSLGFSLLNGYLNRGDTYRSVVFMILFIYNSAMAYTDVQSKMVWPLVSYIFAALAFIFIIASLVSKNITIALVVKHLIIVFGLVAIFKVIHAFGDGDLKIIAVNYLMILPVYMDLTPIIMLLGILIVMIAFVIINIKKIRGGKAMEAIAFAPYLLASVILFTFV